MTKQLKLKIVTPERLILEEMVQKKGLKERVGSRHTSPEAEHDSCLSLGCGQKHL